MYVSPRATLGRIPTEYIRVDNERSWHENDHYFLALASPAPTERRTKNGVGCITYLVQQYASMPVWQFGSRYLYG